MRESLFIKYGRGNSGMTGVQIMCNTWLHPGTIIVSKDLWETMKEMLGEAGRDREFLKAFGIEGE